MKQIMYGIILGIITILSIFLVVSIEGQTTRKNEIENALPNAVERSLEATYQTGAYTITDNEEFIADFTQNLLNDVNTGDTNKNGVLDANEKFDDTLKIKVDVKGVDYKKGLLSIKVTETYTSLNGKEKKAEYITTAILDKPEEKEIYTLKFTRPDGTLYKEFKYTKAKDETQKLEKFEPEKYCYTYKISGEEVVIYSNEVEPKNIPELKYVDSSTITKKTFEHWEDVRTSEIISFPITVSMDRTVKAIYK